VLEAGWWWDWEHPTFQCEWSLIVQTYTVAPMPCSSLPAPQPDQPWDRDFITPASLNRDTEPFPVYQEPQLGAP